MPNPKPESTPLPVPGMKRAVAWVKFTQPVEVMRGVIVTELQAGKPARGVGGLIDVPAMYRDANTQELVIGSVRIALASGLVGPYELADAAKGKTAP